MPLKKRRLVARPFVAIALFAGCASSPTWVALSEDAALQERWVETGRFKHLVLSNDEQGSHLRVYIEGDGSPWIQNQRIALDPTPTNPVLLRLMRQADHPAVYLGRPCYFGSVVDARCQPRWWTFDRYGREIVDSMCKAVNALIEDRAAETVQLIGYSGGGALVVGMMACTERLTAITTIAGNLTPRAWTDHHGYTSLNVGPLDYLGDARAEVDEVHWQCDRDANIPPSITDGYFARRSGAVRKIVSGCSHATGWDKWWPQLVERWW